MILKTTLDWHKHKHPKGFAWVWGVLEHDGCELCDAYGAWERETAHAVPLVEVKAKVDSFVERMRSAVRSGRGAA